jgi:hypothetical protein
MTTSATVASQLEIGLENHILGQVNVSFSIILLERKFVVFCVVLCGVCTGLDLEG